MKSIFKHPEKIDISAIADNEASKITSFLFTIHKSFCGDCKKVFNDYQTLGLKIAKSFDKKLINTGSERIFNFYSATLKAAVYALVVGVTFSSVGIAFAQTQTDVDIIPDVTFFEDGEIISFSEEEVENLFTEVIDPIQATLITFIEPDEITVDEVVNEIEDQVEVLTTLVPEDVVTEEEPVVTEEVSELTGLQNALNQIEQNIALAIQNNNENALNGLENAKEKILENIEKAEEKLQKGNEKAEEKLQKGNEKAKKEIEEAKEKADKILAKVDPSSDEKEVVKAQLKAERTLQKAEEKAQKEIEKAQKEAEKELEKAQKEAQEETEKAQKEAEKAEKKAQKESEKKDK